MKHNKSEASRSGHENKASSNEINEPNSNAAKVTTPANEEYSDSIDHCQEELQQVGLLDSELVESKRNPLTVTTRLSTFVPNFLARSRHQKTSDTYCVSTETRNASTAIRAVKKMKRNGESNNSAPGGDVNATDLESNEKMTNKHSCRYICCVLLFMALCVVAVLAVFFAFSPNVLDKEDKCLNGHKAFHNYNLFSTKTSYTTAISYLDNSVPKPAGSNHDIDTYVSSSVSRPGIFSSGQNLKEINNHLTVREGCKVRQFHFYGRHAARTPDEEDIKKLNTQIKDLISRINYGRHATAAALQQPIGQTSPDAPSSTDVLRVEPVNETVCYDPIEEVASWNNYMGPDEGNLVTEFGYRESEAIARRLKDIYPDLFNGSVASINFAITNEIRTAQTAVSFLNQMATPPDVGCPLGSFPMPANLNPAQARSITGDQCFKNFVKSHGKENLQFHKKCKQLSNKKSFKFGGGLNDPTNNQIIAERLGKELTGHSSDKFKPDDAKAIYDICRYETVLTGKPSVWCRFFKEKDLAFMEYVSDVKDFVTEAYGLEAFAKSACFITKDMINLINDYAIQKNQQPKAYFHFTHSSVIQKLIAATIDLSAEEAFLEDYVREVMKTGDVPQKRSWRTSILTPFSANIAFTLYDCDKTANASISGEGTAREIDLKSLKVVASLNEQPIKMDGCSDYVCDYLSFKRSRVFKLADPDECIYEKVCTTTVNAD